MKPLFIPLCTVLSLALIACSGDKSASPDGETPAEEEESTQLSAVIQTDKGTITVHLHAEQTPVTVANFVNLAKRGFYDGLTFHRVVDDFMIQGGDPTASGSGTPGYVFDDEFDDQLNHDKSGTVSMVNAGPDTNGCQFFITHAPANYLDGSHTVFGLVTEGMETVNAIEVGDSIQSITIHGNSQPLLESHQQLLAEWNATLDEHFPDLKPSSIPPS